MVFESERNRFHVKSMQTCENGRTAAHTDNEKHISAVQSRTEARETETTERKRGIQSKREKEMETKEQDIPSI